MIMEQLLDLAFSTAMSFFDMIPIMHWDLPVDAITAFFSVIDGVAYFFPMPTVAAIFGVIVAEEFIKIMIAFIRLVWKFIPIIGA